MNALLSLAICLSAMDTTTIQAALAKTVVPISEIAIKGQTQLGEDKYLIGKFVIPDRDNTQSAYGGKLRQYDVHLAKIFETTHYLCRQRIGSGKNTWHGISWLYLVNGGKARVGIFTIECLRSQGVVNRFGLAKPETTPMNFFGSKKAFEVPILSIFGSKIPEWQKFVQIVKPQAAP